MKARKWLTAIIIIALLAGYYIFGTGLLKENRRNGDLIAQINSQTEVLAAMPGATVRRPRGPGGGGNRLIRRDQ